MLLINQNNQVLLHRWKFTKIIKKLPTVVAIFLFTITNVYALDIKNKPVFDITFKNMTTAKETRIYEAPKKIAHFGLPKISYDNEIQTLTSNKSNGGIKRAIIYVNGMDSNWIKATKNFEHIKKTFKQRTQTSIFKMAYNGDESLILEIAEVVAQQIKQDNPSLSTSKVWYQTALDWVSDQNAYWKKSIAKIVGDNYVNDRDLEFHITDKYLPLLQDKYKVVILSHSQGNFYANRAWNKIYEDDKRLSKALGVVGIATPATYVANNGEHITNTNDIIINTVRVVSSDNLQPLAANVTHPITWRDPTGHGLTEIYLSNEYESRQIKTKIIEAINSTFDRLDVAAIATCSGMVNKSNGVLNLGYYPGENYEGYLKWWIDAYSAKNRMRILNHQGDVLVDTGNISNQHVGSFHYKWTKDKRLQVLIFNGTGFNENAWDLKITCA